MSTHLGDLLDTARRQRLVGRHRELASFDDAVSGRSPRRLLFLYGPGGIGKTTLLREFRARARAAASALPPIRTGSCTLNNCST
ncbi:AAA family ATPase [Actinoplanes sp. NPDC051513]|uniref:AAA family ATPase n=1 Tax=Actinoplanes sp. NPDC051513 TaxID=3363908 RepID=UPI0037B7FCED